MSTLYRPALFDSINSAQSPSLFRGSPLKIFTKMIVAGGRC